MDIDTDIDKTLLEPHQINHENADNIYEQGKLKLLNHKILTVDFNQLNKFDSSVFAVILAWKRIATHNQFILKTILSPKLQTLANVYGISDIL